VKRSSTNALVHETSPYLLQHAHNPVDWYPWGEEALQKARTEDKPILLSIGYSACHWCHVMAHESFENESVAKLMNENFINIKVDREERPDLDQIYQTVVQMLTGQGGWPLTVFLTPEQEPFWGGTYFPPDNRHGRPGFPAVLVSVSHHYHNEKDKVASATQRIRDALTESAAVAGGDGALDRGVVSTAAKQLASLYDERHGGFGTQPKFPNTKNLEVFLRHWAQSRDETFLRRVTHTLRKMAEGGIYDQLGGGFHRYSVDDRWQVPHFEKMLYDNALLAKILLETYQASGDPFFARIARKTLDYVVREMTHPGGGFYSTQDADSEGEEGKFFVWTSEEIFALLEDKSAAIVCEHFGITGRGNFERGTCILHVSRSIGEIALDRRMTEEEIEQIVSESKKALLNARAERIKPFRDEKILTDWNGMMISSFAVAGQVLDDAHYRATARRAADFVLRKLHRDGRLLHCYKDGAGRITGYLDDYAYFTQALLDLYEATFDTKYLLAAVDLTDTMVSLFRDGDEGGFFFTPCDHESLIHRPKQVHDHSTPSGQSVAVSNLTRLFRYTESDVYREKAEAVFSQFADAMCENPFAHANLICALDLHLAPPKEIVLVGCGKPAESGLTPEAEAMLGAIHSSYLPNKLLAGLLSVDSVADAMEERGPLLRGKQSVGGKTTAYVCQDFTCSPPMTEVGVVRGLL